MSYGYRTPVRSNRSWVKRHGFALVVVLVLILAAGSAFAYVGAVKGTERTVTVKVTDKERVCSSGNSSCKYLIYTDHGTYEDTDSLIYMKFRSSDLYGDIQRGQTYTFKVVGWRLPFFSGYPNIVGIENGP